MDYFVRRGGFTLVRWAAKMGYSYPIAVEGFHSQWDEYVDELHNDMRFMPPAPYRSPSQEKAMREFTVMEQRLKQEADYQAALTRGEEYCTALSVVPDILQLTDGLPLKPPVYLKIKYSGDKFVYKGTLLTPSIVASPPEINCKEYMHADKHYTLVLTDPDAPSRHEPLYREFVHWVVVNIPGSHSTNITSHGTVILNYLPAAPPYHSGPHRYIFLLFEQLRPLSEVEVGRSKAYFQTRSGLSTVQWAKDTLFRDAPPTTPTPATGTPSPTPTSAAAATPAAPKSPAYYPVGVNGFTAEWDPSVDALHTSMGFLPPPAFRSPVQQAAMAPRAPLARCCCHQSQ